MTLALNVKTPVGAIYFWRRTGQVSVRGKNLACSGPERVLSVDRPAIVGISRSLAPAAWLRQLDGLFDATVS